MQWVVQVGFDCEAFQQLNIEWQEGNKLWGNNYETSTINILAHGSPRRSRPRRLRRPAQPVLKGLIDAPSRHHRAGGIAAATALLKS